MVNEENVINISESVCETCCDSCSEYSLSNEFREINDFFNGGSCSIINADSPEAIDFEVFYKGKKVINVNSLILKPSGIIFEKEISWKEMVEND